MGGLACNHVALFEITEFEMAGVVTGLTLQKNAFDGHSPTIIKSSNLKEMLRVTLYKEKKCRHATHRMKERKDPLEPWYK